jgi:MFS family permease
MTVPLINNWFIEHYNWETAWVALSAVVCLSLVIPGWLIIRDRPEDLGMHPDGIAPGCIDSRTSKLIKPTEDTWTVYEVLRDLTFWRLLAVPVTSGLVGTGLVFHQVSIMDGHGFTSTFALQLMSIQAGFAMLMTFPAGWATDRIESRRLLSLAMLCLSIAVGLVITLPIRNLVIVYALLLGLHGSILRSTAQVVWINFYGRENQGAVRGAAWSAMILASAIGPLPLAFSIDHYNSYRPALIGFLVMPLFAIVAVWTARQPTKA